MFIYTENDTESDTRIQNNNLEYKHTNNTNTHFKTQTFQKKKTKIHIFNIFKFYMISVLC